MMKVIKRDGTIEVFDRNKIISAICKSAKRVGVFISDEDKKKVCNYVETTVYPADVVQVDRLHNLVEIILTSILPDVAKSYKDYRNYKAEYGIYLMSDIESDVKKVLEEVDRENSNSNTRYISTKRTEIAQGFSKAMYKKLYLSTDVLSAIKDGYIYMHDLKDMLLPQFNCCLADIGNILNGGFELEGIRYTEPKDIRTAIGQIGDIVQIISAQHFGGHTVPEVDKILAKYYDMTIINEYDYIEDFCDYGSPTVFQMARERAYRELKQSLQGFEIKMNTVVSARGSYPFTTLTFGDVKNDYEADIAKAILEVRMEGHGEKGFKKNLIFPKLVFLYNPDIHGEGKEYEWLFDLAVKCSAKCMYPDYLSPISHKRESKWVSPMGCRAYLSDYRDEETGELVFTGRFNIGAISLNLPMIYMKAKTEKLDFYNVLDYYLEMIRDLHKDRYEYLGKAKASSNPLMFCQGGAYGGNLNPDDRIAPLLKSATASFGITALNELQILHNGKSLAEDNKFCVEVMDFINKRVSEYKEKDGHLYAIYNTPAESLCGTQVQQFRDKYGVIDRVSDKEYFTNSNHLWVGEEVTPFEKQDKEIELFNKSMGGHIGYVRISNPFNLSGLKNIIRRGISLGYYQGVNFNACFCENCGYTGNDFGEKCPRCGSTNIDETNRTCGYLGYSRKRGDRTFNDAKMAEIRDRVSM
jgi:ribonucleoside-triphosphate reductase